MIAVEAMGADPALTDAVVLLEKAKNRVADFVDAQPEPAAQCAEPIGVLKGKSGRPVCLLAKGHEGPHRSRRDMAQEPR